jgi:DNA-binding NtrC family response regulator
LNVIERTALIWDGHGPIPLSTLSIPASSQGHGPGGNGTKLKLVPEDTRFEGAIESYTELKKRWCDSFELEYLTTTLRRHGGNVSAAARDAKLDRSNFLRLLRKHNLKAQEYRKPGSTSDVDTDMDTDTGNDQGGQQAA